MGWIARIRGWIAGKAGLLLSPHLQGRFRYHNDSLASNETIFSAISILAGDLASLPLALKHTSRQVHADEHPVAALYERGPCPNFTTYDFIRAMEVLRHSTGAAYAVKELDHAGRVQHLWLMKTECVSPQLDTVTRELYYRVFDEISGETFVLHSSHVIAVGHISQDGIHPINPIDVLRSTLDYDREVKEFSIDQMQNSLRANVVIKWASANVSAEQIEEYNDVIRRFKKSGVLYLDNGKDVTELKNASLIDPKTFDVENITIARVARVYNIPLDRFLPEKSSYNSAEQSDLNYLRDTLLPSIRMYEQVFDRGLLSAQDRHAGYATDFDMAGFARADMKTRGEYFQRAVRSGWMCLDEVRRHEGLPAIPGGCGKLFLVSKDLIPIQHFAGENKTGNTEGSGQDA